MKDWRERERSTEEIYGDVYGAVSQVPGVRVFPRLDPPLPTPGQYDVEMVLQSDALPEQMLETTGAVLDAGWKSGKFLYVDTDLKIDLPEARVVLDREQIADLGLDLASVGPRAGHAARRQLRQPLQLLRSQLQGDSADRRRGSRDARAAARSQDQDAGRPARAGFHLRAHRDEHGTAHAEPLSAAQRRAHLRRRESGRDERGSAARARGRGGSRRRCRA